MSRLNPSTAALLGRLAIALALLAAAAPAGAAAPPALSDAAGLTVEWRPDAPVLEVGADGLVRVSLAGFENTAEPGAPLLPEASRLLALPAGAQPEVEIVSLTDTWLALPGPLERALAMVGLERGPDDMPQDVIYGPAPERPAPDQPVTLTEIGEARGVRLASLRFRPLLPQGGGLRFITAITVRVWYHAPTALPADGQPAAGDDPIVEQIRRSVANPDQVRPALPDGHVSASTAAVPDAYIEVSQPGLTAITRAELAAAGLSLVGVDPHNLALSRGGNPVAMEWEGDADDQFEDGERLLFYALPRFSRWTSRDAYALTNTGGSVARMTSRSGTPTAAAAPAALDQVFEQNTIYTGVKDKRIPAGRDGDRWVWDSVSAGSPATASRNYTADLLPVDATKPATLTVWLVGYTTLTDLDPDHQVTIRMNGTALTPDETWDGIQAITVTRQVPAGRLQTGTNTLNLSLPLSRTEGVYLDAFALRYSVPANVSLGADAAFSGRPVASSYTVTLSSGSDRRAYDVTDPDQPVRLTGISLGSGGVIGLGDDPGQGGRRYIVATAGGIRSPAQVRVPTPLSGTAAGSAYLVLTTASLKTSLQPLLDLRQSQGLTSTVEDVQAVYDAYASGRPEPTAIRAFLADLYAGPTRPTYVLLAGDGTYDPRRYLATSEPTVIPPFLAENVDTLMAEAAADNRYADVSGDTLPEYLIGRLPINNVAEADAVVAKIVQYETAPLPGDWNRQVEFVTDNPDEAGNFYAEANDLARNVPAPFAVQRSYLYTDTLSTVSATRTSINRAFQFGAGLIVYLGHGSVRQWAGERLWHRDDVANLTYTGRPPVVLAMTCSTSFFHEPGNTTLDEVLVRKAGNGAVAVWGPAALGFVSGHSWLASGFLTAIYTDGTPRIGAAAYKGKLLLAQTGNTDFIGLIETFTLLGDPATQIHLTYVPWASSVQLPFITR